VSESRLALGDAYELNTLSTLIHLIGPWDRDPERNASYARRPRLSFSSLIRKSALSHAERALRQGRRVLFVGEPETHDMAFALDIMLLRLLQLRRNFVYSTSLASTNVRCDFALVQDGKLAHGSSGDTTVIDLG
jgi:hypothetical protein